MLSKPLTQNAAPSSDPSPEFMSLSLGNFDTLMAGIPGFRGEVLLQIEFGRIILRNMNPRYVADATQPDLIHEKSELLHLLSPSERYHKGLHCQPFFSKLLTVIPPDVERLVNMRTSSGEKMWLNDHKW